MMTRLDRLLAALRAELEKGQSWLEADGLTEVKFLIKFGANGEVIRAIEVQPNFHSEHGLSRRD